MLAIAAALAANAATTVRVGDNGHVSVPFDLSSGHVWVRGVVNGSDSLWIVVDTGASSSAIDDGLAKSLGLERRGTHSSTGAGGAQTSTTVANVTLAVGGITVHGDEMDAMDFGALSTMGHRPMQLVLGAELFEGCVVRFDYAAGTMDVWDHDHAPSDPPGVTVPMTLLENHPYVEGELRVPGRAPLRGRFVIDSGSGATLIVAPDVVLRDSLVSAFPRTLDSFGLGVGGVVRNHTGRADAFSIGELRFERPLVLLADPTAGRIAARGTLGNIGGQLLGRCRVSFDYRRRRITFERAAHFGDPFEAEMSGLALLPGPSGLAVRYVNPGTPASEAGLRERDLVTRLDGRAVAELEPNDLRQLLRGEGRELKLEFTRAGTPMSVTLRLRRLL